MATTAMTTASHVAAAPSHVHPTTAAETSHMGRSAPSHMHPAAAETSHAGRSATVAPHVHSAAAEASHVRDSSTSGHSAEMLSATEAIVAHGGSAVDLWSRSQV